MFPSPDASGHLCRKHHLFPWSERRTFQEEAFLQPQKPLKIAPDRLLIQY
jgi:hypothetical protein